ncbi:MAG: hypothetical protein MUP85_03175 [Candidatus Lokiarchaeota archaeon]|nr:hypothetical protein [Candidatus Lokiarchaeota archaeon]
MVVQSIILNNKSILSVNDFLSLSADIISSDLLNLDFDLDYSIVKNYLESERTCPIVHLAKTEDAEEISKIFQDIYQYTYPYKKMESAEGVREMINSNDYLWFIFKLENNETIGCFGTQLDFAEKRGNLYGFVVKKKYHKIIDAPKAFIGCVTYIWKTYQDRILLWYGEMRTNESTSQFFTSMVGLKPIAFLPNKDIFNFKIESDILHVIYDASIFKMYRKEVAPHIIRQVLNWYAYSSKRYSLQNPQIENPNITLNQDKIKKLSENLTVAIQEVQYGNQIFKLSFKGLDSSMEFIHNPHSKNFEKTRFKVSCLEELYSFLKKIKDLINTMNINYFECFVSGYEPTHQKIFYNAGFRPRGYVPCWYYNKITGKFEDQVVFNYYRGKIAENIRVIAETKQLLDLSFNPQEKMLKGVLDQIEN